MAEGREALQSLALVAFKTEMGKEPVGVGILQVRHCSDTMALMFESCHFANAFTFS